MGGSSSGPFRRSPDAPDEGAVGDPRYGASLERLRAELSRLVDAMDELALEVLRDAAEAGAGARPELERRVTRARNGIERALHLLGGGGGGQGS